MPARKSFLLAWLVFCGIVGLILAVRQVAFPGLNEAMDFRQLYSGGYLLRTDTANLYNLQDQKEIQDTLVSKAPGFLPFNHPPFEALLFAPFSLLPYSEAYLAFAGLNVLLLLFIFLSAREVFSRHICIAQPRPGLQIFAFLPVIVTILQGQNAIIFLFGLCLVYRTLVSEKRFVAGCVLGLLLFKPQIALLLAVFLAAQYGFSLLTGFGLSGAAVGLASGLCAGWSNLIAFVREASYTGTVSASGVYGTWGVVPLAMPNLRGMIFFIGAKLLTGKILLGITLSISAIVALGMIHVLRQTLDTDVAFSLALTAAMLLSYHLSFQDLTFLLLPFGLMAKSQNRSISRAVRLFYLAAPILFIASENALFLLVIPVALFVSGIYEAGERQQLAVDAGETFA